MCDREKIEIETLMQNEADAINVFVRCVEITAETHMLKTGKLEGAHYAAMKDLQKRINEKLKRTDEYKCPTCGGPSVAIQQDEGEFEPLKCFNCTMKDKPEIPNLLKDRPLNIKFF